jgi:hypothetical protein
MVAAGRPRGLCWGGCSALLSLLSPVAFRFNAAECTRTLYGSANARRDAEETEQASWGTAWLLSAYSVSGQQANLAAYRVPPSRTLTDAEFHPLNQGFERTLLKSDSLSLKW